MACVTFKDAKLWWYATGDLDVVADSTARDLLATPDVADHAYQKDDGIMYSYATSSWAATTTSHAITGGTLSNAFGESDTTDTDTTGTSKEFLTVREDQTLSCDRMLYSGANKVTGKGLGFTFNSVEYPVTDVSYSRSYDEIDCTGSTTASPYKSFTYDRYEASGSATIIVEAGVVDPVLNSAQTLLIEFDSTNVQVTGTAIITGIDVVVSKGDKSVLSVTFKYTGAVTETGMPAEYEVEGKGLLAVDDDKGYSFPLMLKISYTATANVSGDATVSETWRINGGSTDFSS